MMLQFSAIRLGCDLAESLDELGLTRHWRKVWLIGDRHAAATLSMLAGRLPQAWVAPVVLPHNPVAAILAMFGAAPAGSPDAVIAVGGGSLADAAKILLAGAVFETRPRSTAELAALATRVLAAGNMIHPDLIQVPTTYATAAFTPNAALSADNAKLIMRAPFLRAEAILCDANLLAAGGEASLATAFGALNHCIEGLSGQRQERASARRALEGAADILIRELLLASERGLDARAAQELITGSWMASFGVQGARLGAGHALPHVLGAVAGVPHAATSALMVLDGLRRAGDGRMSDIAKVMRRLNLPLQWSALGLDDGTREQVRVSLASHKLFEADVRAGDEQSAAACLARID
jgi:maleylacetate reductase